MFVQLFVSHSCHLNNHPGCQWRCSWSSSLVEGVPWQLPPSASRPHPAVQKPNLCQELCSATTQVAAQTSQFEAWWRTVFGLGLPDEQIFLLLHWGPVDKSGKWFLLPLDVDWLAKHGSHGQSLQWQREGSEKGVRREELGGLLQNPGRINFRDARGRPFGLVSEAAGEKGGVEQEDNCKEEPICRIQFWFRFWDNKEIYSSAGKTTQETCEENQRRPEVAKTWEGTGRSRLQSSDGTGPLHLSRWGEKIGKT